MGACWIAWGTLPPNPGNAARQRNERRTAAAGPVLGPAVPSHRNDSRQHGYGG